MSRKIFNAVTFGACLAVTTTGVFAQTAQPAQGVLVASNSNDALQEIIVTAEKRQESANSVPMSITAVTGDTLREIGVLNTADLVKTVPGLTYTTSTFSQAPVYTLRGVGLFDSGFASAPAVSVYIDEVPLPFSVMTAGATLDLEQVEVLKGPQGTLFGENSTGGAINYIAAKPTREFAAGASSSVSNFGQTELEGFVSGPITDTLEARVAFKALEGGAWQYSTTRSNDKLGDSNLLVGRLLLDWHPLDRLKFAFSFNINDDQSDTQAPQLSGICSDCDKTSPSYALYLAQPDAPHNARAADWSGDWPMHRDNQFLQPALRVEYRLTDQMALTSITSYARQTINQFNDSDATTLDIFQNHLYGSINSLYQETRLSGDTDKLNWLIGASFSHATSSDNDSFYTPQYSKGVTFPGATPITNVLNILNLSQKNAAAFANAEYKLTNNLSVQGGVRYTESRQEGTNCDADGPNDNDAVGSVFEILQGIYQAAGIKKDGVVPIPQGACYTLNQNFDPGAVTQPLDEHNVSYRFGVNYKFDNGTLLYATDSRGFKQGVISNINASTTVQYIPAVQEKLDAYEAGFKAPLFDHHVQLNAAGFDYEYHNKQVVGDIFDPIWGPQQALINVPKSRIWGFESAVDARPVHGLTLSAGATYLRTEVTSDYTNINQAGTDGNFKGSPLPFAPKWQATSNAKYEWDVWNNLVPFVGGGLTYHSADIATFAINGVQDPNWSLPSYTTLDLRAGVGSGDGRWRVSLWGRNVADRYYVLAVQQTTETRFRYTGQPATFGVSAVYRFSPDHRQ